MTANASKRPASRGTTIRIRDGAHRKLRTVANTTGKKLYRLVDEILNEWLETHGPDFGLR